MCVYGRVHLHSPPSRMSNNNNITLHTLQPPSNAPTPPLD